MMLDQKRGAIVVGINTYMDKRIPALKGSENNANEIYERLGKPDVGNFEIQDGHFLMGHEATSEKIRKAISDTFFRDNSYDLILFYFSGHGFVDASQNGYIAPYDMISDEPFVYGINLNELRSIISSYASKSQKAFAVIILDCVYSGIVTTGVK
jgi:hypothetical protein